MTYDHIIIGSGAGGSAAAYRLADAGKQVLLLEKGAELPRDGSTLDVAKVAVEGVFNHREPWCDGRGRLITPQEYFNLGGKTKWYGAALARFGEDEFIADEARKHLPWPIGYDDLAPFYREAEELLAVRPFTVEPELRALMLKLDAGGRGWRATALPLGLKAEILSHADEARHFDGFASVNGFKADGETALIDRVRHRPNFHLRTRKAVIGLLPKNGSPAEVEGVICADGSRFNGKSICLAAGALHSPRLVQRYLENTGLDTRLPAYRSVGRYYKSHIKTFLIAWSRPRKTDLLRKTVLITHPAFPHSSLQTLGWLDGPILAAQLPPRVPSGFARLIGERAYGFFIQTEDGSDPANRVTDGDRHAVWPRLDYRLERLPAARSEHRRLLRAFRLSLLRAGYLSAIRPISVAGTAHACGTLAAGSDPNRSVVDAFGRLHGMANLYVVDGSVLPRISRVNPALTIYAWALRTAERLVEESRHE
jgi:choline dehydrogenase-like flavoprotein